MHGRRVHIDHLVLLRLVVADGAGGPPGDPALPGAYGAAAGAADPHGVERVGVHTEGNPGDPDISSPEGGEYPSTEAEVRCGRRDGVGAPGTDRSTVPGTPMSRGGAGDIVCDARGEWRPVVPAQDGSKSVPTGEVDHDGLAGPSGVVYDPRA